MSGEDIDVAFNLTPGGKLRGWVVFEIDIEAGPKWLRADPDRVAGWRTFLENHRPEIWASDFFTVHTLWFQTLYLFFFIAHDRRTVMHLNITAHPTAQWVWRQLINATPWGTQPRFLIRDRDRAYGGDFIARARAIGIKMVLTPIATPQANAIAERLVGTMRRECLDHIIVVNERHLRHVLHDFVRHYNNARPHQSLELEARTPSQGPAQRQAVTL